MSKLLSYWTNFSEYFFLYSWVLYLQATSVSGYTWKRFNSFSIPSIFFYCWLFCRILSEMNWSKRIDSMKYFWWKLIVLAWIFATRNVVNVSSGNQTMVACVGVVGSQYPRSFLQGKCIPWHIIVSSFESRVSNIFSNWVFQSKYVVSWYPFFVSALQFEGLFIPICGFEFLLRKSYVKRLCTPCNGYLSSNVMCPWYLSSSIWCPASGNTWKFTNFWFVSFFCG